ncbi:asparaginase [Candidatus Poribacteria bacterium]|nr:asparaginase [Candidatus Poribacteria bacterium]
MIKSEPMVHVVRSGLVDLVHHGCLAVADTEGKIVYSVGDPERPAYMRSSAKPLQAIATVESGALEEFNLNKTELAIMCASHAGQDIHVQTVRTILGKIGLSEAALQCSTDNPIRDNCSGKHAGMLTFCVFHKLPVENYLADNHPVQIAIRKVIAEICDLETVEYGIDGCGAPNFYMPLRNMALGFARLANPDGLPTKRAEALSKIVSAMQAHPEMTGEIRDGKTWPKEIVAKGGALGAYCGGILNKNRGIAVKIDDGSGQVASMVFTAAVRKLNLANLEELDAYENLHSYVITNRRGEIVGKMEVVF